MSPTDLVNSNTGRSGAREVRPIVRGDDDNDGESWSDVARVHELFAAGHLVHPYLEADAFGGAAEGGGIAGNFTDLAAAVAEWCGAGDASRGDGRHLTPTDAARVTAIRNDLVRDVAGEGASLRHVILLLCDGMGTAILDRNLDASSFLRRHNQPRRLRAVFPSTTPAALTSLATAEYPGRHGVPGWDLRDVPACEFPGVPCAAESPVQIRILAANALDSRSGKPLHAGGWTDNDIFCAQPWAERVANGERGAQRRMTYINAFNGDDFTSWYQGKGKEGMGAGARPPAKRRRTDDCVGSDGEGAKKFSDFSSWSTGRARVMGQTVEHARPERDAGTPVWFDTATINEVAQATIGNPEGSAAAIAYFREGLAAAERAVRKADAAGESAFVYVYTAHPDKHMHALGVDHHEVATIVRAFDVEIAQLWERLGNVGTSSRRLNTALVVTADHGHVTITPGDMVVLPDNVLACLEYANIGVHGKGRHGVLHCRAGLQGLLRRRWRQHERLTSNFALLTTEEAVGCGLFGPEPPQDRVRPRLGDYIAVALNACTLVTAGEAAKHKDQCQGGHGSVTPDEMRIPFVLCTPEHTSS